MGALDRSGYVLRVWRGAKAGATRVYKSAAPARRAADRLDLEYGAVCCTVSPVWSV